MREPIALSDQRLANTRGAAFLLAIYFASLMLFLLGGVSLQRTMTEVRAAQTSRDLQQAFWAGEASFDKALADLRLPALPAFDDLGCVYENVTLPTLRNVVQQSSGTTLSNHGSYMICRAALPDGSFSEDEFQTEMMGLTPAGNPVWISAFLRRQLPEFTLGQAIVGVEGVTLRNAEVGGVHTDDPAHPVTLLAGLLLGGLPNTAGSNDGWGNMLPTLTLDGFYNNQGHIGTKSVAEDAIQLLGTTVVHGGIVGGAPAEDGEGVFDAAALGGNTIVIPDTHAVHVPTDATAYSLADTLLPSTRTVDAAGNITITNKWAAVSPGSYYAKSLTLTDSSFSTNGPVDLYIDGSLTVSRSLLYGQPATEVEGLNQLDITPANLRVYVASNPNEVRQVLIERGSVAGGVIYAPQVPVKVTRKSLVMGGVVGKTVQVGLLQPEDPWNLLEGTTQVYFDQSVAGMTLHPAPELPDPQTLFYRVRQSLSEASNVSELESARLVRWFEFSGVTPQQVVQATGGKDEGGMGWGGGCDICGSYGGCY